MTGYPPQHANWPPSPATTSGSERPPSLYEHPEFQSMRGAFRAFGAIAVTLVVGGFLLYVLLSSFAPGVMNQPLAGHLTLGLAQFAVMALAVWRYTVHMRRRVDPVARRLRAELDRMEAGRDRAPWERPPMPRERRFPAW
ncbi:DUF485 domain-containing protein [Streptomyces sp. TP-A0356]|uniref:DUF485 domain-containing protein n=1 Tax=Streptomyces sp. TP-A0356 TaxID=1359208 RepID=UPI0006E3EAEF|nr:DUF485 domain-containing protein [Streptomyces sp. TP-A0356]